MSSSSGTSAPPTCRNTAAPGSPTAASADLDAARLLLARMGISAEDLLAAPTAQTPVPTFAEYIPVVAAVTDGTRRVYSSYWNRIVDHWGHRHSPATQSRSWEAAHPHGVCISALSRIRAFITYPMTNGVGKRGQCKPIQRPDRHRPGVTTVLLAHTIWVRFRPIPWGQTKPSFPLATLKRPGSDVDQGQARVDVLPAAAAAVEVPVHVGGHSVIRSRLAQPTSQVQLRTSGRSSPCSRMQPW